MKDLDPTIGPWVSKISLSETKEFSSVPYDSPLGRCLIGENNGPWVLPTETDECDHPAFIKDNDDMPPKCEGCGAMPARLIGEVVLDEPIVESYVSFEVLEDR